MAHFVRFRSLSRSHFFSEEVKEDFEISFRHKFVGTNTEDIWDAGQTTKFPLFRETPLAGQVIGPDGVDPGAVLLTAADGGDNGSLCTIFGVDEGGLFQAETSVEIGAAATVKTFRAPLIEISVQGPPGKRAGVAGAVTARIGATVIGVIAQGQSQSFIGCREVQVGLEQVVRRFKCGLVREAGQGNKTAEVSIRLMEAKPDEPVRKRLAWPLGVAGYRDVLGLDEHFFPGSYWFLEGESDAAGAIVVGTISQEGFFLKHKRF